MEVEVWVEVEIWLEEALGGTSLIDLNRSGNRTRTGLFCG